MRVWEVLHNVIDVQCEDVFSKMQTQNMYTVLMSFWWRSNKVLVLHRGYARFSTNISTVENIN